MGDWQDGIRDAGASSTGNHPVFRDYKTPEEMVKTAELRENAARIRKTYRESWGERNGFPILIALLTGAGAFGFVWLPDGSLWGTVWGAIVGSLVFLGVWGMIVGYAADRAHRAENMGRELGLARGRAGR